MNKSLLEQLPEIVRNGKRRVQQILESPKGRHEWGYRRTKLVTLPCWLVSRQKHG